MDDHDTPDEPWNRWNRSHKKIGLALVFSAIFPGWGSAYAEHWISALRTFVLFALALWAATVSVSGMVLAMIAWIYGLVVAYCDVQEYNRGYRHARSYFHGLNSGQSTYGSPFHPHHSFTHTETDTDNDAER
jgi:hypothetical protein